MAKDGAACRLGKTPRDGNLIIICRRPGHGSDGARRVQAGATVYVAFDAGNLAAGGSDPAQALSALAVPVLCGRRRSTSRAYLNKRLRSDHGIADALHGWISAQRATSTTDGTLLVDAQLNADDDGVQVLTGMTRLDKAGAAPGAGELRLRSRW